MCENEVEVSEQCNTYRSRTPPPPLKCSVRAWKGSRLCTCSTLAGSTRHAVYRWWPSKPLRPTWDYPGSGEPASNSPVDVCECMTFHKAFSVGLLCPRVMKPVSVDEQNFPGYRHNIAKWLIKDALRIGGCLRNRVQSQVLQIHHCPRSVRPTNCLNHLARVRKTTGFGWKYLYKLPRSQMQMVQLPSGNIARIWVTEINCKTVTEH